MIFEGQVIEYENYRGVVVNVDLKSREAIFLPDNYTEKYDGFLIVGFDDNYTLLEDVLVWTIFRYKRNNGGVLSREIRVRSQIRDLPLFLNESEFESATIKFKSIGVIIRKSWGKVWRVMEFPAVKREVESESRVDSDPETESEL